MSPEPPAQSVFSELLEKMKSAQILSDPRGLLLVPSLGLCAPLSGN